MPKVTTSSGLRRVEMLTSLKALQYVYQTGGYDFPNRLSAGLYRVRWLILGLAGLKVIIRFRHAAESYTKFGILRRCT